MFWSQTNRRFVLGMLGSAALAIASGVQARDQAKKGDTAFTIAVIPDTQNYLDFTHQAKDGFPFDAAKMFMGSVANSDTVSKIGLMYCQGQLR